MNIFNSLGSNYDSKFTWQRMVTFGSRRDLKRLEELLAEYYEGQVVLTYKGRQALEICLTSSDLAKGSAVGINGFTCYALYEAVKNAGYTPVPIDVPESELNFGVDELEAANKGNKLKAIIIQNTLGLPVDMPAIAEYAKKHNIVIIEDLAHSLDACYANGQEAGKVGDFTMLSFSQDKPLDVVAGGAVIDRRTNASKKLTKPNQPASLWQRKINRLYPLWTSLIRAIYPLGLGRYLHFGLKKLHLLATPMSDNIHGLLSMDQSTAKLLVKKWPKRSQATKHRQAIAGVYKQALPESIQVKQLPKTTALYLRFPIIVSDRKSLVAHLKNNGIYIGDTWYDAPIGPKRYMAKTDYVAGDCPNSEELTAHIVNLPTHVNVSEQAAKSIASEVNKWLKLQKKQQKIKNSGKTLWAFTLKPIF